MSIETTINGLTKYFNLWLCFQRRMKHFHLLCNVDVVFHCWEWKSHFMWIDLAKWKRTLCKLPHEFQYIVSIGNNLSRCSNFIPKYYSRTRTIRNIFIELASDSNRIVNVIWNRHVLFTLHYAHIMNCVCYADDSENINQSTKNLKIDTGVHNYDIHLRKK